MPDFELVEVDAIPYLYLERSTSRDPEEIAAQMGDAFQQVWNFMTSQGIATTGGALSVYHEYDPDGMHFRAGFAVDPEALKKADGYVRGDTTPAGEVLYFTHKGSYATLHKDYEAMVEHVAGIGREISGPAWEVYLNDPIIVSESALLTESFVVLK